MIIKDSSAYSFIQISNELRANLEKLMLDLGLHSGQVLALESLWQTDCQSQADLVRNLSVTAPTVYNLVTRLARNGFVNMRPSKEDKRIMHICLTQKGIDVRPLVESQWIQLENSTFANLNDTEKMMFSLLLKKLKAGGV